MEKSCSNCAANVCSFDIRDCAHCEMKEACLCGSCNGFSNFKPDYPTLERENAELKQQLSVLSAEWNRQHEKRRKAQLQVTQLEHDLRRQQEVVEMGFTPIPKELDKAAEKKLAGKDSVLVSLTSGGKLSRWAAAERKKKRKGELK